jgi:dual specificity MAP kinase phosphatase
MSFVLPHLYIGSAKEAMDKEWLSSHKITHIINCASEIHNFFPTKYSYFNLMMKDLNEKIDHVLPYAYEYMKNVYMNPDNSILVHCYMGVSRSATVVIYFLMRYYNITLDRAYKFLKQKRSSIQPNIHYIEQLLNLAKQNEEKKMLKLRYDLERQKVVIRTC